jgi:hypothetical protein
MLSVVVCIEVKLRKQCNIEQIHCDKNFIHIRAWHDFLQHAIPTTNSVATHGFFEVRDENIM